jgi:DNA-binding CsgD family transcriptional regulator
MRSVSLTAFERSADPILVTDDRGEVRFLNKAAADFLRCDQSSAAGVPCWELVGMRTKSGAAFCGPDCPVQRQARAGTLPVRRRLFRPGPSGPVAVDVSTVLLTSARLGRRAVLHLLVPVGGRPRRLLARLSPREGEVLDLLAGGHSTRTVADRLFISPTTVCNHVQSILRKLDLHSRLEAILIWLGRSA